MAETLTFLRENARWLLAGGALAFASSVGQTFFLALFGPEIRADLGLSHGQWGGLYTVATVAAAATLMAAGGLADRYRLRILAPARLAAMAVAAAAALAGAQGPLALGVALFLLRFLGQGFCGHLSVTAVARWLPKFDGCRPAFAVRRRRVPVRSMTWAPSEARSGDFLLQHAPARSWLSNMTIDAVSLMHTRITGSGGRIEQPAVCRFGLAVFRDRGLSC